MTSTSTRPGRRLGAPGLSLSRALILALACACACALLGIGALPAAAGKAKVYKYETRDGRIDYGSEVPEGAVVLAEVGETEVKAGADAGSTGSAAPGSASATEAKVHIGSMVERLLASLAERPLGAAGFAIGVYLWAILVVRAFPPLFSTLALDLRRSARLVTLIVAGWLVLALLGHALDWLWATIGWSPRSEFEPRTLDGIALLLYALVAVVAFAQRLGVGVVPAALLAALWLAVVLGSGWAVWVFVL